MKPLKGENSLSLFPCAVLLLIQFLRDSVPQPTGFFLESPSPEDRVLLFEFILLVVLRIHVVHGQNVLHGLHVIQARTCTAVVHNVIVGHHGRSGIVHELVICLAGCKIVRIVMCLEMRRVCERRHPCRDEIVGVLRVFGIQLCLDLLHDLWVNGHVVVGVQVCVGVGEMFVREIHRLLDRGEVVVGEVVVREVFLRLDKDIGRGEGLWEGGGWFIDGFASTWSVF